jgi:hypothetical protein
MQLIRERLGAEIGRIEKQGASLRVALAYPSPYAVGMSSLGYQLIYRAIQAMPGIACERVFLPDGADEPGTLGMEVVKRLVARRDFFGDGIHRTASWF